MKYKYNVFRIFMILAILIFCIIAIAIGVYTQFFYKYGDTDKFMLGKVDSEMINQEIYTTLKNNFNNNFTGSTVVSKTIVPYTKSEAEKGIVYGQKISETRERQYSLDTNIPVINIRSEVINQVNTEIASVFKTKLTSILSATDVYTIYNVNYVVYVNENILSIAIRATLKEGTSAQRGIMQTYNYDMENDKLLSLTDVIEDSNMTVNSLQDRINKEISSIVKQNEELELAGYSVHKRNVSDEIYLVENSNNFILSNEGYLYIIYAYGNKGLTSELDIIII